MKTTPLAYCTSSTEHPFLEATNVAVTWFGFSTYDVLKYGRFGDGWTASEKVNRSGNAWDWTYNNLLKDGAMEGSSDITNRGTINQRDVVVGCGVISAIATLCASIGLYAAGATIGQFFIPTISLFNSIDDIGTNNNNESILQQYISDPNLKNHLSIVKIGVGTLSTGFTIKNLPSAINQGGYYGVIGGGIDGASTTNSIFNYKKQ